MRTFQELLDLAEACYRQAHASTDPFQGCELTLEGDEYVRQAKESRHSRIDDRSMAS